MRQSLSLELLKIAVVRGGKPFSTEAHSCALKEEMA